MRGKTLASRAVKYGPQLIVAARFARGPAEKAAREALERRKARRDAIDHADGITSGTLARVSWRGNRVWIVWSGDTPVAAYPAAAGDPSAPVPLTEAVRHVDLAKRRTADEVRADALAARTRRAARARLSAARRPGRRALP